MVEVEFGEDEVPSDNSFNGVAGEFGTPGRLYTIDDPCRSCSNCMKNADDADTLARMQANGAGGEVLGRPRPCLRVGQQKPLRQVRV